MTKLFHFLRHLSPQEYKRFREFVHSSYFNKREDLRRLIDLHQQGQQQIEEEQFFKAVYPDQDFSKKNWHLLCSRLFKLGEKFLVIEELNKNEVQQKLLLAKVYRKQKQPLLFQSVFNGGTKSLEKQPLRDAEFWQHQHTLAYEYYDFVASHNRKQKTNLQEVNDYLDYAFISRKLQTACLAYVRQIINQETYRIPLLEETLTFLEAHPEAIQVPSIQVYYYYYKVVIDPENEEWFTRLRKSIKAHLHYFQRTEQRDILLLAINYCIRQLNTGKPVFIREAFELYRLSLTNGFLVEDGIIAESTFVNIVSLAANLKEYDWMQQFIEEQQTFLKPVFQQPIYHFCTGRLLYEKGQYDESMRHLAQVDTKASFLLLGTKVLQLKIYYKQKEFEAIDYILESLRVYLQRRKNLGYRKQGYEMLIYFFRKLLDYPYQSKSKQKEVIKELSESKAFFEKEWMLEQLQTAKS